MHGEKVGNTRSQVKLASLASLRRAPLSSKGDREQRHQHQLVSTQLDYCVFLPIEAFERDEPTMRRQERLARRAEELGFAALWFRDVPLRDPNRFMVVLSFCVCVAARTLPFTVCEAGRSVVEFRGRSNW